MRVTKIVGNPRILRTATALTFENMENVGKTGHRYVGREYTSVPLNEDILPILMSKLNGPYNPKFHALEKIQWDDGSWSWASVKFGQDRIYILSACGSPLVTLWTEK